jgi:hypothetical protein
MSDIDDAGRVGFPHVFECRVLHDLPSSGDLVRYYYPGATREGGRDGLNVEVRPHVGAPWIGTFAFGDLSRTAVSGAYALPDPTRICVIARGQGYVVRADDAMLWELVEAVPVMSTLPLPSKRLLVLATFTELLAYGETGIRWRTKRLSSDGLEISGFTETVIQGKCWDATAGAVKTFSVDLATGRHEGGADLAR